MFWTLVQRSINKIKWKCVYGVVKNVFIILNDEMKYKNVVGGGEWVYSGCVYPVSTAVMLCVA